MIVRVVGLNFDIADGQIEKYRRTKARSAAEWLTVLGTRIKIDLHSSSSIFVSKHLLQLLARRKFLSCRFSCRTPSFYSI